MDRKITALVFLTVALDLIGFGILIPIQPFFAKAFGAAPKTITLLGASYSLMQFMFVAMWGRLSDRFGRRPIMLISIATSALGFLIFAFADSIVMLFISRMISGFGGANIGCAQAIMADISSEEDRVKGMGLVGAAVGCGFVIGPALGGLCGAQGFVLPSMVAFFLSAVNFILVAVFLKETRWSKKIDPSRRQLEKSTGDNRLIPLMVLSLLIIMAFSLFEQSIAMYIDVQFSVAGDHATSIERTALFLVTIAVVSAVVQMVFLKPLTKIMREEILLMMGAMLAAFSLVIMARIETEFFWLFGPGILFGIGMCVCMPCISSIISKNANVDEQGSMLAKSQTYSALGRIIGPALCGLMFEYKAFAPFIFSSMIMVLVVLITKFFLQESSFSKDAKKLSRSL